METLSALLAICDGNPPVTDWFPSQIPVNRSFDLFFDLHLNEWLKKIETAVISDSIQLIMTSL